MVTAEIKFHSWQQNLYVQSKFWDYQISTISFNTYTSQIISPVLSKIFFKYVSTQYFMCNLLDFPSFFPVLQAGALKIKIALWWSWGKKCPWIASSLQSTFSTFFVWSLQDPVHCSGTIPEE